MIARVGYDASDLDGAIFNLIIGNDWFDLISESVPQRADVCQVRPLSHVDDEWTDAAT